MFLVRPAGGEAFPSLIPLGIDSQESIPPKGKGFDLSIGDGALEHPKAAVGMEVMNAFGTQLVCCFLDGLGDFVSGFNMIHLDIDDAQTQTDFRANLLKCLQVFNRSMS